MGIERVLKEKFGDALKDIRQVFDEEVKHITVEVSEATLLRNLSIDYSFFDILRDCFFFQAVNTHLDILRPAIKNYGGSVEVLSVEGEDCVVKYVGPESIGMGIKAAIKEKFKDISNVTFTS